MVAVPNFFQLPDPMRRSIVTTTPDNVGDTEPESAMFLLRFTLFGALSASLPLTEAAGFAAGNGAAGAATIAGVVAGTDVSPGSILRYKLI